MLGFLLIYFIGKKFYDLAGKYSQNKWLYAILSIIVYYVTFALFGILLGILILVFELDINLEDNVGINLLAIPIGLLGTWGFYVLLKNKWKKSVVLAKDEINNIGKSPDELSNNY